MLMVQEKNEVISGGIKEINQFRIAANSKAFRVLIDGLYSDKPRAIIRELWSNALDAHIAAGTPERPFKCNIPTPFSPEFLIRDYGVSLSHDAVMGLYTTVFASTKDKDNSQVGKFGLGSKTPFAYTEQFTVTAYLNGEKRTYSAFINEDNVPTIALFSTEETLEENGLEISFPVKLQDVSAFKFAAETVAHGFDVKPICNIELPDQDKVISGNGWALVSNARSNSAQIRQGCVLYPIDKFALPSHKTGECIFDAPLVIDFPMGEIEITPSRESISYDARTIANIEKRVAEVTAEINSQLNAELAKANTLWEARLMFSKIINHSTMPYSLTSQFIKFAKWRNKDVSTFADIPSSMLQSVAVSMHSYTDLSRKKLVRFEGQYNPNVSVGRNTFVIVQDMKEKVSNAGARVKRLFTLLEQQGFKKNLTFVWIKADMKSFAYKKLIAHLGRPPVINLANVVLPANEIKPRAESRAKVRILSDRKFSCETDASINDVEYYVPLAKNVVDGMENDVFIRAIYLLKEMKVIDRNTVIYGINGRLQKHLSEDAINLLDLIQQEAAKPYCLISVCKASALIAASYENECRIVDAIMKAGWRAKINKAGSASAAVVDLIDQKEYFTRTFYTDSIRHKLYCLLNNESADDGVDNTFGKAALKEFRETYKMVILAARAGTDKEFSQEAANFIESVNRA